MESPEQGRPNRETGLPPGVEVGPLGKRFVAFLINLSVPVIVSIALIFLLPNTTGALRVILGVLGAAITLGWLVVIWYTLAVRAASPGLRAMKLQLVGFLDGRPIGPSRVFVRALVFWALYLTGIGLLIMLIMMLRHPRRQGWHDLAVTSVMIKERLLAPPVQPARAAADAQLGPPAQVGTRSQPQPSGVRAEMPPSYALGEGYASAGSPVPPGALTPPPGMAPTSSGSPYAAAVPPGGSASSYGGNAYATPYSGAPYAPPYGSSPTSQPSGDELSSAGQQAGASPTYEDRPEYTGSASGFSDQTAAGPGSSFVQDWSILLDDGRRITLEGLVLLGRNPQPKAGEEDAQLIKIADETRTVSKSHLAVGVDAGGVYVVDRGSTNGSTVSTTNGMSSRCRAGEMVRVGDGAIVSFGDHWLEITRG
ncbi:MAG TPA: RDD family protein [Propionibacteriaceae bacterium]